MENLNFQLNPSNYPQQDFNQHNHQYFSNKSNQDFDESKCSNQSNQSINNDFSSHKNLLNLNYTSCSTSSELMFDNNLVLIEKCNQKLVRLHENLKNDNFDLSQNETNDENVMPDSEEANTSKKLKYKSLTKFKKDVVVKKLMKTIDLMNQQLNKRDQLIANLEKENLLLNKEKYNHGNFNVSDEFNNSSTQEIYLKLEIKKLKQEILDMKVEKDTLNQKIRFLEKEVLELKYEEASFHSDYKEIVNPLKTKQEENDKAQSLLNNEKLKMLEKENTELVSLNNFFRNELDKLSNQIYLLEKEKNLEGQISEEFQNLVKLKSNLENENENLKTMYEDLKEERNNELIKYYSSQKQYQNQIFDLEKTINEQNQKLKGLTKTEMQLNEAFFNIDSLNEEKRVLIKTVNQLQEKNDHLHKDIQTQNLICEDKIDALNSELQKQQSNFDSVNAVNLDLQKQIQKLLEDLDHKQSMNEKHNQKRLDELKSLRHTLTLSNEKLNYQKVKFENQIDEIKKQHNKEFETLKSANDKTVISNGELSRSNTTMRNKIKQLENEIKDLNEKIRVNKLNMETIAKQKKEIKEAHDQVVLGLKKEIECLEQLRDEYAKKNHIQQDSIEAMLEKMNNFQEEFEYLVKCNTSIREKMDKINHNCETYKKKYYEMKLYLKKIMMEEEKIQRLRDNQTSAASKQEKQKICQNTNLAISTEVQANLINSLFKVLKLDVGNLEETLDNNDANTTETSLSD